MLLIKKIILNIIQNVIPHNHVLNNYKYLVVH